MCLIEKFHGNLEMFLENRKQEKKYLTFSEFLDLIHVLTLSISSCFELDIDIAQVIIFFAKFFINYFFFYISPTQQIDSKNCVIKNQPISDT